MDFVAQKQFKQLTDNLKVEYKQGAGDPRGSELLGRPFEH